MTLNIYLARVTNEMPPPLKLGSPLWLVMTIHAMHMKNKIWQNQLRLWYASSRTYTHSLNGWFALVILAHRRRFVRVRSGPSYCLPWGAQLKNRLQRGIEYYTPHNFNFLRLY
jgi:hypothetical protein